MTSNKFKLKNEAGWLCVTAPAKVNLFLHITGRRENGYHEIESVFAYTKFGDSIKVRLAEGISLAITGEFSSGLEQEKPEQNLVFKAARALQKFSGNSQLGADVVLEKNMPIAAGVGGGSSDAAATIKALVELWQIEISTKELMALALELGADVPACLNPHTSFVSGIGENVERVDFAKKLGCILVNPNREVSTKEVFNNYASFSGGFTKSIEDKREITSQIWIAQKAKNDLYISALKLEPEIQNILNELDKFGEAIFTRMSGSGATCFALTNSAQEAERVASQVKKEHPSWWVVGTEFC